MYYFKYYIELLLFINHYNNLRISKYNKRVIYFKTIINLSRSVKFLTSGRIRWLQWRRLVDSNVFRTSPIKLEISVSEYRSGNKINITCGITGVVESTPLLPVVIKTPEALALTLSCLNCLIGTPAKESVLGHTRRAHVATAVYV